MKENSKALYEGKITHTEDTLERLFKTERQTYHQMDILIRLAVGFLILLAGLFSTDIPGILKAILIVVGGLILLTRDFSVIGRAQDVTEKRGGNLPVMRYVFYDSDMHLSGEGSMHMAYGRLHRLIEDRDYFYLFQGKGSVCMMEKASLKPRDADALKEFLSGKTGLKWGRTYSLLSMNLFDLRQAYRDFRGKE